MGTVESRDSGLKTPLLGSRGNEATSDGGGVFAGAERDALPRAVGGLPLYGATVQPPKVLPAPPHIIIKKNGLRLDFGDGPQPNEAELSTIKKGLYEVFFAALSILQPQDKGRPTSFDGLQVNSTAETRRALAFANEFLDTAHRCGIPLLDLIDDEARMAIGCSLNGYLTASVLPRLEAPAPADVAYMCKRLSEIIDKWEKRELHHVPDVDLVTATLLVANEPDSKAAKMLKAGAVQRLLIRTLEHRLGWLCGRPEHADLANEVALLLKRANELMPY